MDKVLHRPSNPGFEPATFQLSQIRGSPNYWLMRRCPNQQEWSLVSIQFSSVISWVIFSLQFVYVCVSVCLSVVCLSVSEQNCSRTAAPIWTRFSLDGCLLHWLEPFQNWWVMTFAWRSRSQWNYFHLSLAASTITLSTPDFVLVYRLWHKPLHSFISLSTSALQNCIKLYRLNYW